MGDEMKKLFREVFQVILPKNVMIPEEYHAEFELDVMNANIERERVLALILMIIDLALFIIDALVSRFWTTNVHIFGKFGYLHYLLFVIPVIFLVFTGSNKKVVSAGNIKLYRAVHIIALLAVMGLSAAISAGNPDLPPFGYTISMFCIASLIIKDNYKEYFIYILSYVIYAVVIAKSGADIYRLNAYLIFLASLMILLIIFSAIIAVSYKKGFVDRKLILEKNMELNSLSTLLIRNNAVLSAQLETSIDGIIVIDKKYRVLCYNQKFVDILGLTGDVMKYRDGMRIFQIISASVSDEEGFGKKMTDTFSKPDKAYFEKISLNNGTILDIYTAPILYFSEEYGRVWYIRDITEKEKMLEALRLGSEMNERLLLESQKYDELKNEFFANISHEFRTPLNVILGTLQLMGLLRSEKYDHEISTRMNKYIGSMKQNCYRLLRLTNNLIDMTRLDTGFYEVNLQYCNIVEVVEDITLSVADFIENRGIELIFDTDVEEKIIAVDTDKIERIMLNLLSNAVKFTEQRGIIIVSIHDKGESIEISVKDTGIGIPEDKLTIIFERFRQVNSSLTRDREGSGIGLSLTQHLVKLLGGSINVVSRVGEGSEFMIELPCIEKNGEDQEEPFAYKNKSHVDRINIEFSDIYSVSDDHKSRDSD